MRRELHIGDISKNGQIEILDEDRLCYIVRNVNKGSSGVRTISKALLEEFVKFYSSHSSKTADEARAELKGSSNIDKYEYGYKSTLALMAKMILGIE